METIDKRWYTGYSWYITVFTLIIAVLSLLGIFSDQFTQIAKDWGLGATTLVIAICTLIFRFSYFEIAKNKKSIELNILTFLYAVFYAIMVINLIHLTGWLHSWYLILFAQIIAFAGFFGIFTVFGTALIVTIYLILAIPEASTNQELKNPLVIGLFGGAYLLCLASYFFWKIFYIDVENQQINKLSGMLKSNRQQSEILIQSIADGVIVTDTTGTITLMNPAAFELTKWPVDEALGIDVRLVVKLAQEDGKPLEEGQDLYASVFNQKKSVEETMSLVDREKKQKIVSIVISPIILPKSQELVGSVAVLRDVSVAKQVEKQRADFISTASHEMRTPVAAIEGYLALALNDRVSKIDLKARGYLEKAHESTQHLGKLFQDLLTSAKAEDGRLSSNPIVVNMNDFMDKIAEDLRFITQKKHLRMEYIVSNHETAGMIDASNKREVRPLYYAHIDPDRFREVVTNVFDNAVKYTEEGAITLSITGNDDVVQVSVADTGPGIPSEDLPHLFQKFYRVDNSSTRTTGGTGLGLFICKKIVELYGGRIWAESTIGKGTTFYINIPRISASRAAQLQLNEKPIPQA